MAVKAKRSRFGGSEMHRAVRVSGRVYETGCIRSVVESMKRSALGQWLSLMKRGALGQWSSLMKRGALGQ